MFCHIHILTYVYAYTTVPTGYSTSIRWLITLVGRKTLPQKYILVTFTASFFTHIVLFDTDISLLSTIVSVNRPAIISIRDFTAQQLMALIRTYFFADEKLEFRSYAPSLTVCAREVKVGTH